MNGQQSGPATASVVPETAGAAPLLELRNVSKQYPGVLALDDVDFDLFRGEVHVLFGENGAGKSTLINIVAGAVTPTSGELYFRGESVDFNSVYDARRCGISAVFQEFSLIPQLTVGENLTLGAELTRYGLLDKKRMRTQARESLATLGFDIPVDKPVRYLSRAEKQMVEIASAIRTDLSLLILDEPTASLTEREAENLFNLVRRARDEGVGIIYITHRISEIKRIGDRVTVLRDGKRVITVGAQEASEDQLLEYMSGRVIDQIFPQIDFQTGEVLLDAQNLTVPGIEDISFSVSKGEIVGFAGLVGAGKSRAARVCAGIVTPHSGRVLFDGEDVTGHSVSDMLQRGLFYVPPDRHSEGLVMVQRARENMSLSSLDLPRFSQFGFIRRDEEKRFANGLAGRLNLQPRDVEKTVDRFSGGNQQKVLLAKTLTREVRFFIFDEPTVGVDVSTRVAIYQFMAELCAQGAAILLVSSDLPEVLHLSNRAYVFHQGKVRTELQGEAITEENVLNHFFSEENHD